MSKFTKVYKKWHAENNGKYDSARVYHKALMCNFIDWQLPKPLVVVPQIVSDFIEVRKKSLKLYDAFQEIEECYCGDLYNFVCQKSNGQDLFARAWLDGYTVEKGQLYEVVFSKCEDGDRYLLFANIEFFIGIESMNDGYYRQQFTEAEIKEIDERYWAFAVEVDE